MLNRIGILVALAAVVASTAFDGVSRGIYQLNTQLDIAMCGLLTISSILELVVN